MMMEPGCPDNKTEASYQMKGDRLTSTRSSPRSAAVGRSRSRLASPSTQIETTLLIHPHVLADFLDYNDFLGVVDQLLEELRLCGTIQVAGFHPQYRFAGTEPDAAENYTNRSPYPMLHLLRETSVSQATDASDEVLEIPRRNIETMRNLGREHILKRLQTLDAEH